MEVNQRQNQLVIVVEMATTSDPWCTWMHKKGLGPYTPSKFNKL